MEFVGLDKLSILDYEDYISAVIFTPKCNFRCPFCHNGLTVLNSQDYIPFDEIMDYLKERKTMLDAVVVTGGEPTMMPELKERIRAIKNLGYRVKLDSNGTHPEIIKDLVESNLIDYVAMDIKNSIEKYPETVGTLFVNKENIKASIDYLMSGMVEYEFRTTLVEEFHSKESIEEMGQLIKGARILYLQKFVERDGCIKKGLHEVPIEIVNEYKTILEKYVDKVELRGY